MTITHETTQKWLQEMTRNCKNMPPTELTHQVVMAICDPQWTGTLDMDEEKVMMTFNKDLYKLLVDTGNLYKVRTVLKRDMGKNKIAAEDDYIKRVLDNYLKKNPNPNWI